MDRYGRPLSSEAGRKELERFYHLDEADDDDEVEKELKRVEQEGDQHDPARHGGFDASSSSEEESSEDEESAGEDEVDIQSGKSEVPMGEETRRLAVVNMDWDNVRAVDLMAVAESFCPNSGRIMSVTVYPSEYGRERLEREQLEGPPKELFARGKKQPAVPGTSTNSEGHRSEEDSGGIQLGEANEEAEVDSRALRSYQISRLRYYYGVIACDNVSTASTLYKEMDGREYLSSANFFDLRFVPDTVTFDDIVTDKPRDQCDRLPAGYKPNDFVTEALMHSKVKLTWEAEDKGRMEAQKRAFSRSDIDDNDLKAYIGSDSDSDETDEATAESTTEGSTALIGNGSGSKNIYKQEEARRKTRALLGLPEDVTKSSSTSNEQPPSGNMQITFTSGLASADPSGVFANNPEDVREESTREKYIRKEKERKARRKEKAKASRKGTQPTESATAADSDSEAAVEDTQDLTPQDADALETRDPFDDSFFTDPAAANASLRKEARKAEKRRKAEASAEKASQQAQELEHLQKLVGDDDSRTDHFDMAAIKRKEKNIARKGKKGRKRRHNEREEQDAEDNFKPDLQDPRFEKLFGNSEFAIDPTNPRFSGTRIMKAVLEEGRKKRRTVGGEDGKRPTEGANEETVSMERPRELDGLVAKVKKQKRDQKFL